MIASEGASRMSSVFGLKVSPSTAIVLPRTWPPHAAITLRAIARLRWSLTAATVSTSRIGAWWSCAVLLSATVEAERAVQLGPNRLGARILGADHDAVGPLEVGDRGPFAQELRVRDD